MVKIRSFCNHNSVNQTSEITIVKHASRYGKVNLLFSVSYLGGCIPSSWIDMLTEAESFSCGRPFPIPDEYTQTFASSVSSRSDADFTSSGLNLADCLLTHGLLRILMH